MKCPTLLHSNSNATGRNAKRARGECSGLFVVEVSALCFLALGGGRSIDVRDGKKAATLGTVAAEVKCTRASKGEARGSEVMRSRRLMFCLPISRYPKTSTPEGNRVLTPQPAPTRESESFARNRARGRCSIGIRNPTRAEQREYAPSGGCRKPRKTLGINAKTPGGTLSAFSVNWTSSDSSQIS